MSNDSDLVPAVRHFIITAFAANQAGGVNGYDGLANEFATYGCTQRAETGRETVYDGFVECRLSRERAAERAAD